MQGIFIHGARPTSKKQVKEAVMWHPESVRIEATSLIGNDYDGPVSEMPQGTILFVGPDPRNKRNFYGQIEKTSKGFFRVT
jgi:hypothetical protein